MFSSAGGPPFFRLSSLVKTTVKGICEAGERTSRALSRCCSLGCPSIAVCCRRLCAGWMGAEVERLQTAAGNRSPANGRSGGSHPVASENGTPSLAAERAACKVHAAMRHCDKRGGLGAGRQADCRTSASANHAAQETSSAMGGMDASTSSSTLQGGMPAVGKRTALGTRLNRNIDSKQATGTPSLSMVQRSTIHLYTKPRDEVRGLGAGGQGQVLCWAAQGSAPGIALT